MVQEVKKVLVLASLYGSKRVLGLAKYLPEFGWQPTIVTPPISWQPTIMTDTRGADELPLQVHEIPCSDPLSFVRHFLGTSNPTRIKSMVKEALGIRGNHSWVDSLFHSIGALCNYPDSYWGWHKKAYAALAGRVSAFDAILSICPVSSHVVASKLKQKSGVRWVADLPDLWSQNFNYSYGSARRLIDQRLERKTMTGADAIVTSSVPCASRLSALHGNRPVHTIVLGYDPQDYNESHTTLSSKFTITYTGLVYSGKQAPRKLLEPLSGLLSSGGIDRNSCSIRLYGCKSDWIDRDVNDLRLSDMVQQHDAIPHNEIVRIQRESQVLLLLDWDDPRELGGYTAKVFEYLGARRPILAVGGVRGNAVDELLDETKAGVHATTASEVRDAVLTYYRAFKKYGAVAYGGNEDKIRGYSQVVMAEKFADLLRGDKE